MPATYTVKQVADILGYSTNSIYSFLKARRIKGVRLGKGRFRIPQAELDRLLQIKNGGGPVVTKAAEETTVGEPVMPRVGVVAGSGWVNGLEGQMGRVSDTPSLFDLYLGMASVVLGVSMFLFSRFMEEFGAKDYQMWLLPLKVMFISGGLGVLYTDFFNSSKKGWHQVFHWVLVAAYLAMAALQWRVGMPTGWVVYGVLGVIVTLNRAFRLGSVRWFVVLVSVYVSVVPLLELWAGGGKGGSGILGWVRNFALPVSLVWLGGVCLFLYLAWRVFVKRAWGLWVFLGVAEAALIVMAYANATQFNWGRSFLGVMMAVLVFILPVWDGIRYNSKRERLEVAAVLGTVLAMFVIVVVAVVGVQRTIMRFAGGVLRDKASYGGVVIEGLMQSAKESVTTAAANGVVAQGLKKKDGVLLSEAAKELFLLARNFRTVGVMDAQGVYLAIYPEDSTALGRSFASSEHFIQVSATKQLYVSQVFQAQGSIVRPAVVIGAPVVDVGGEFLGEVVGSLDLAGMSERIQKLADRDKGEYFVMIDGQGRRIIHPDDELVGVVDSEWRGKGRMVGKAEEIYADEKYLLESRVEVDGVGWGLVVRSPILEILESARVWVFAFGGVFVSSVGVVAMYLFLKRVRLPWGVAPP